MIVLLLLFQASVSIYLSTIDYLVPHDDDLWHKVFSETDKALLIRLNVAKCPIQPPFEKVFYIHFGGYWINWEQPWWRDFFEKNRVITFQSEEPGVGWFDSESFWKQNNQSVAVWDYSPENIEIQLCLLAFCAD